MYFLDNLGVLIQARSSSERLPEKVFLKLQTKDKKMTVLEWIYERLSTSQIKKIYYIVPESDTKIINFLERKKIPFLCGPLLDVRERYRKSAEILELKHIIRATADNPFVEPLIVSDLVENYFKYQCDLFAFKDLPLGAGLEIFSFEAISKNSEQFNEDIFKEHVSLHIKKFKEVFKVVYEKYKPFEFYLESKNYKGILPRLTLDYIEDYKVFATIFPYLNSNFTLYEVMDLFISQPKLFQHNLYVQQRKY